MIREKILNIKINYVLSNFPSKTLSKKTWTKCLLSLSKFFDHLCQRIGGKSCKHEKMAPTLTKYENIAVTLYLMSIAFLRRKLRDRARVRRRATRSWLLRRKQRSAYNTFLNELHTEDPNEANLDGRKNPKFQSHIKVQVLLSLYD
jgi:hypothetical protein